MFYGESIFLLGKVYFLKEGIFERKIIKERMDEIIQRKLDF